MAHNINFLDFCHHFRNTQFVRISVQRGFERIFNDLFVGQVLIGDPNTNMIHITNILLDNDNLKDSSKAELMDQRKYWSDKSNGNSYNLSEQDINQIILYYERCILCFDAFDMLKKDKFVEDYDLLSDSVLTYILAIYYFVIYCESDIDDYYLIENYIIRNSEN
jgi:hypothetical protein